MSPVLLILLLSANNSSHYFLLENTKTSEAHLVSISDIEPVLGLPFCRAKLSAVSADENGNSRGELAVVFARYAKQACDAAVEKNDYFLVSGCLDVAATLALSWDAYNYDKNTRKFPIELVNAIRCDNFNRKLTLKSKFGPSLHIRVDRTFTKVLDSAVVYGISDPTFNWQRKKITKAQALDFMEERFKLQENVSRSRKD